MKKLILLISFLSFSSSTFAASSGKENNGSLQSGKEKDCYLFNVNNISMPIDNKGVLGDVNIDGFGKGAKYGGHVFLYSGGFFLSGKSNGKLWANAQASASLTENYIPGRVGDSLNHNNQIYVVTSYDQPFGQSWIDWKDAVALGADFYDGDKDGIYNPVDKNNNGTWDKGEDMPDLIGDCTAWCVYNDGQPTEKRDRFPEIEPQGIEIRQTVAGIASKGQLGNFLLIRYRFLNTGLVAAEMDSVYFGVWADPDLGDCEDDLVGCDVERNIGYVYNRGQDSQYGNQPPCFAVNFVNGPMEFIPGESFVDANGNGEFDLNEEPLDTAWNVRGPLMGDRLYPGAKNMKAASFVHYQQSDPDLGDPDTHIQARSYMLGCDKTGKEINPCVFPLGEVKGMDCNSVNNKFWYSGDPVTNTGWINTKQTDQRIMFNVGPFNLPQGFEKEIVVAYIIGQGTSALNSITAMRGINDNLQKILDDYKNNATTPVKDQNITPDKFVLAQNYPNPFNPSTTISFELPGNSNVKLAVYNLLGEEVKVLVNSPLSAGTHKIEFNGSDLASGMYIYRLTTEQNTISKKAILLK